MLNSMIPDSEVVSGESSIGALRRRLPVGAEILPDGGAHFRVWAPHASCIEQVLETAAGATSSLELKKEPDGYFSVLAPVAGAGGLYRFRLDDGHSLIPYPRSRFHPDGPL